MLVSREINVRPKIIKNTVFSFLSNFSCKSKTKEVVVPPKGDVIMFKIYSGSNYIVLAPFLTIGLGLLITGVIFQTFLSIVSIRNTKNFPSYLHLSGRQEFYLVVKVASQKIYVNSFQPFLLMQTSYF